MSWVDGAFDRTGALRRPSWRQFLSEVRALRTYRPAPPDPTTLPHGGGHVVLVLPAFLTGDDATYPCRNFLRRCGYRPLGWGAGLNWGPTPRLLARLRERLSEACRLEGGRVSVVGISLGGIMARDLAYDRAADIRRVVTLASPIRLPTASPLEPLIRICARFYSADVDLARLATPLPVPSTAIYTRDDGVVAWETCMSNDGDSVAVEVGGPHLPICRNPAALRAIATSLATAATARRQTGIR